MQLPPPPPPPWRCCPGAAPAPRAFRFVFAALSPMRRHGRNGQRTFSMPIARACGTGVATLCDSLRNCCGILLNGDSHPSSLLALPGASAAAETPATLLRISGPRYDRPVLEIAQRQPPAPVRRAAGQYPAAWPSVQSIQACSIIVTSSTPLLYTNHHTTREPTMPDRSVLEPRVHPEDAPHI